MTDLTRQEIEGFLEAPYSMNSREIVTAITQLLYQLDVANARADAAAGQMRERCAKSGAGAAVDYWVQASKPIKHRKHGGKGLPDCVRIEILALPLHEEPRL